jgi:hypothetical protein
MACFSLLPCTNVTVAMKNITFLIDDYDYVIPPQGYTYEKTGGCQLLINGTDE